MSHEALGNHEAKDGWCHALPCRPSAMLHAALAESGLRAWILIVLASYIMYSKPRIQARPRPQHLSGVL